MKIGEASKTLKRRLEMLDIGNNMGNGRKCKCGEKETSEHLIRCEKDLQEGKVKLDWLKETNNLEKIRKVNEL